MTSELALVPDEIEASFLVRSTVPALVADEPGAPASIPFLRPSPPRLSELVEELVEIERSGIFSNYGPTNTRLEEELVRQLFHGVGACLTVNSATTGLMIAIKQAALQHRHAGRYAILPSFTFAATAHAAIWAGLTPILCDVDPHTWMPDPASEQDLLEQYGGEVAVMVPYATFGNALDIGHYDDLARRYDVGVVIDAAASLGSFDADVRGFGTGSRHPVVYSMHATKTFATAEAGAVYCADETRLAELRAMGNFGFTKERTATMAGLNAKLSEIGALLALKKLDTIDESIATRARLVRTYQQAFSPDMFQRSTAARHAHQFLPMILPRSLAGSRDDILASLARQGIGSGKYFSPHLAEHPYFQAECVIGALPVTDDIASRIISLPLSELMTEEDVRTVCRALQHELAYR